MSEHHHSHDRDHTEPPSDLALRVQALESLLIEKGRVDPAAIASVGYTGRQGEHMKVVENTPHGRPIELAAAFKPERP